MAVQSEATEARTGEFTIIPIDTAGCGRHVNQVDGPRPRRPAMPWASKSPNNHSGCSARLLRRDQVDGRKPGHR